MSTWYLPLLFMSFIVPSILSGIPSAGAQQDGTKFLTYTNTDLGFIIKYPPDWTANDSSILTCGGDHDLYCFAVT